MLPLFVYVYHFLQMFVCVCVHWYIGTRVCISAIYNHEYMCVCESIFRDGLLTIRSVEQAAALCSRYDQESEAYVTQKPRQVNRGMRSDHSQPVARVKHIAFTPPHLPLTMIGAKKCRFLFTF